MIFLGSFVQVYNSAIVFGTDSLMGENIVSPNQKRRMWQFVVLTADLVSSIWTVGEFGFEGPARGEERAPGLIITLLFPPSLMPKAAGETVQKYFRS